MIYFLSDLHASLEFEAFNKYISENHDDDLLILLGDLELAFRDTEENRQFNELLLNAKCPIAMIDGNHENYDFIYSYPTEEWNGGMVHRLSPYLVHLMRGYIYTIEGKSFLAFGGCRSSEGWRLKGLYWPQQEASEEEYERAYRSLAERDNRVDYILTHKYHKDPNDPYLVKGLFDLTYFIDDHVDFKCWYSGHGHMNWEIDKRHRMVYDCLTPIE